MFGNLYSNQGYRRNVHNWNAMDVMNAEGLLVHGTIIAVEPDGLVVDFGCEDMRRELVQYNKAFSCRHGYSAQDKMQPGCDVEVLLPAGPQKPWVWFPATLLAEAMPSKEFGMLKFVEVHLGGFRRREVVEYDQVRLPPASTDLQSHLVNKDDFHIWSVPLPAYLSGLLPTTSSLWKVLCQKLSTWMLPMSVTSDKLLILGPSYCTQGHFKDFNPECMIRRPHEEICRGMAKGAVLTERGWRCCLPLNIGWVEPSARGLEWTLHDVHPHMLKETFTYLDTMEKTQRRRVCRAFDALLTQVSSWDIWISCQPRCGLRPCCSGLLPYYQLTASILNCATCHTRRIILANSGPGVLSELLLLLKMCVELGLCALRQQVSAIAFRCNFGIYSDEGQFWEEARILAKSMAGGRCKQLLLRQCTVGITLPDLRVSGPLPLGWRNEDLCRLVEDQLPAVDLPRIAEAVALAVHLQSRDRWEIVMVLEEFTKPDPRETNAYQGYEWSESDLHTLDLAKLSSLAQYALSCRVGLNLFDQLPFLNGF